MSQYNDHTLKFPVELGEESTALLLRYAEAMAIKMVVAEKKHNHGESWLNPNWESDCRDAFMAHIEKGDPLDVGIYTAFMWHHKWKTAFSEDPDPEEVLVVMTGTATSQLGLCDYGMIPFNPETAHLLMNTARFLPRQEMETSIFFKQIIPYVVLTRVRNGETEVLIYTRGKKGGEKRLHAKRSVGVGGHINPVDSRTVGHHTTMAITQATAYREVKEEVKYDAPMMATTHGTPIYFKVLGWINNDGDDVGRVHLGLLMTCEVHDSFEAKYEESLNDGEWIPMNSLTSIEVNCDLEPWSKIAALALLDASKVINPAIDLAKRLGDGFMERGQIEGQQ